MVVSSGLLPSVNATDSVAVVNIYQQTVPRATSVDLEHRSLIGSGLPTATNPHGITVADLGLSSNIVQDHQNIFHACGIQNGSNANALLCAINTGSTPHQITVTQLIPATDSVYLGGFIHSSIATTVVTFNDILSNIPTLYNIYALEGINQVATLERDICVAYADTAAPNISLAVQLMDLSDNAIPGAALIQWTIGSPNTLSFKSVGRTNYGPVVQVSTTTDSPLRLFDDLGTTYLDVFVKNSAGSQWTGITSGTKQLNIASPPTPLTKRLKLCSVPFSGVTTGYLGTGFGVGNSPNGFVDRRLFGLESPTNLRDDVLSTLINPDSGIAWVKMRNLTNNAVSYGNIVGLSLTSTQSVGFITVTSAGSNPVIGVVLDSTIAAGAYGRIAIRGLMNVTSVGGVGVGQAVIASSTLGLASSASLPIGWGLGVGFWLETAAVAGTYRAILR